MTPNGYREFIKGKLETASAEGLPYLRQSRVLFDWQRALVRRALAAGRYALFCDTGTGKTLMQLEWARNVPGRVLILAPLAVAEQTSAEAKKLGMSVRYVREETPEDRVSVANYEMLHAFDPGSYAGVVLDESSILKAFNGSTRQAIIQAFRGTSYRLACTATPSPNDHMELGNHSEFLGHKSYTDVLAEFFINDCDQTQKWRLKRHAQDAFWRWACSWASVMSKPSDIGFSDEGYSLPELVMHEHVIPADHRQAQREQGSLFALQAVTLSEQRIVRRATMHARVEEAADLAQSAGDRPVIVWCELNAESAAATKAIPGAVEIVGSDSPGKKAERMLQFSHGGIRVLVSKPSICGFGMNWQHCADMIFMGASHSFEQTYQAIRRCWRFGQKSDVHVHVIRAETEEPIVSNYRQKERAFLDMRREMIRRSGQWTKCAPRAEYAPAASMEVPSWLK